MVVVPKTNGKIGICVDLTKLNESVRRSRHILPAVEETLTKLKNARIFTKLASNSGFWQIPFSKENAKLTTFITPFGRFHFNRLPFGITSAPEYFQHKMSQLLEGLEGTVSMMDDILVCGTNQEEHDFEPFRVPGVHLPEGVVTDSPAKLFLLFFILDMTSKVTEFTNKKGISEQNQFRPSIM
jgi:hypothetical protein